MKAGWLRECITLERLTQGKDTKGGNVNTWTRVARISAGVEALAGGIRKATGAGGGEYEFGMYELTIRYRPGITREDMRVIWEGKALQIQDIRNPRNRNESLVLTCKEGQRGNA